MKDVIAFVVVTYRPKKANIDRLINSLRPYQVNIIDNTKNNVGYGGGANIGLQLAFKQQYTWVIVLNDDMKIDKESINSFVDSLIKKQPGIVGPFAGELDKIRWTTIYPSKIVDYISGSFIAIHKDVYATVGNFFEPYFIYYEEVDLCVRAKRNGFQFVHVSTDGIKHGESKTFGAGSFVHQYYHSRNHLLFIERQGPWRVKVYEYLRLPLTVLEHVVHREWGALAGIRDYFLRRFGQYNKGQ